MNGGGEPGPRRGGIGLHLLAAGLALALAAGALELWRADLKVPFAYAKSGDVFLSAGWVKGTLETGWYLDNPRLGAPGALDLRDFGTLDHLPLLALRLIDAFARNWAATINLYFLLGFPLIAAASLSIFRRLGLSDPAAVAMGILYAFLPYHLRLGQAHLFLSGYFCVPFAIGIALRLFDADPLFSRSPGNGGPGRRGGLWAVAGAAALPLVEVYYAFFGCFFFLAAGVCASLDRRSFRPAGAAILLCAVSGASLLLASAPHVLKAAREGRNKEAFHRKFWEADRYGLRVAELVLPDPEHRLRPLAKLGLKYARGSPEISVVGTSALGLAGTLGFVSLLVGLFRRGAEPEPVAGRLARLNAAAVLLGATGGLGILFALFVSPQIRAYNRLSVFIAFLSLAAAGRLLDRWSARAFGGGTGTGRKLPLVFWTAVVVFGFLDLTSPSFVPDHERGRREFEEDAAFVSAIENALPAGARVFQIPYVPYPENPRVVEMSAYDHLRGYFHSKSLRWSFGAMKGREADRWQRETAALPPREMIPAIARAGFSGLWLDRRGFKDSRGTVERDFSALLSGPTLESQSGRFAFYPLPPPAPTP